jgi:alpha-tubulin suppressor-like RCC1 family protein
MKKSIIVIFVMFFFISPLRAQAKPNIQEILCVEELNTSGKHTRFKGGLAYNGEFYLYIEGYRGDVYKSEDGIKWEQLNTYVGLVYDLIWDGKQFVAVTYLGIEVSNDGVNWEQKKIPDIDENTEFSISAMAYTGELYAISGSKKPKGAQMYFGDAAYYYSYDLNTFYLAEAKHLMQTIGGHKRPTDRLIWNGEMILGLGNGIALSKDGKIWSGEVSKQVEAWMWGKEGTLWDGRQFIDPTTKTSTNGVDWTHKGAEIKGEIIGFNGKEYMIVDDSSEEELTYYYSEDGVNWIEKSLSLKNTFINAMLGTDDGFILAGNRIVYIKTKGVSDEDQGFFNPKEYMKAPEGYGTLAQELQESVRDIAVDDKNGYTYMVISDDNNLYELGHALDGFMIEDPRKVLSNVKKVEVSAVEVFNIPHLRLSRNAAAVTYNNELYMWGHNHDRQVIDTDDEYVRYPIKIMDGIKDVSIGNNLIYIVTEEDVLYAKGIIHSNVNYSETDESMVSEEFTEILRDVKEVVTSPIRVWNNYYTITAAITQNDDLYMWGYNSNGELGNGNTEYQMAPIKVMENVKQVSLKGSLSTLGDGTVVMALNKEGEVFIWGALNEGIVNKQYQMKPIKILDNIKYIEIRMGSGKGYMVVDHNNDLMIVEKGNDHYTSEYIPQKVMSNVKMIKDNANYTIVLHENGEVFVVKPWISNRNNVFNKLQEFVPRDKGNLKNE